MPVQRSLAIDYTHDPKVFEHQFQHQYLFGPSLMVIPVESTKDFVRVYFPKGNSWYSLYNGERHPGNTEAILECPLHRLPLFVKSGAILPMQPVASNTNDKSELLIIHLYAGDADNTFLYYEDDGNSFDYQQGAFSRRLLHYQAQANTFVLEQSEGSNFSIPIKNRLMSG